MGIYQKSVEEPKYKGSVKEPTVLDSYLEAVNSSFGAALEKVDFLNNSEEARQYINEWIDKQTEGYNTKCISPRRCCQYRDRPVDFTSDPTVWLRTGTPCTSWINQVYSENTNKRPFKLISNKDINVDTMFMINKFNINYIENPGISVLELPYGTDKYLSMFILLPDNNTVFHMLDKEISYEKLTDWTSNNKMKFLNMAVHLPKFRIEQGFSIRNVLSSLGLTDPFNESRANFSQMTDRDNLYMSDVHHKTFVEVNEKGTEAASATAAVINSRSGNKDEFDANHPFHLFIQEKKTQCILIHKEQARFDPSRKAGGNTRRFLDLMKTMRKTDRAFDGARLRESLYRSSNFLTTS
ncbi:serpin B10 [Pelobates cultripes]|uniref:Serpin B10 n=1 Tax=Pelobates cultripes TaxID=61616 RepID=A0AAD1RZ89_PELCU|nr:serpin B10 [Pelobates cultripes]